MLYPFAVLLGGVVVWDYLSPSDIMGNYPHLVIVGTGLAFGFLVGRMILAHLCDEPKGLKTNMCMSLLYLPFAIANALTARLNDGDPLVDERLVLLLYCVFSALIVFGGFVSVCSLPDRFDVPFAFQLSSPE
ncbi:choline/ethanolaminephosphotransferase 1-like isoform X1 [Fagus crenata]